MLLTRLIKINKQMLHLTTSICGKKSHRGISLNILSYYLVSLDISSREYFDLRPISTSFAIRKSHAILCLKFACELSQIACERSQCDFDLFAMFDFLQTFACEPLSLERSHANTSSQLENNFTTQRDKGVTRYQKETDFIG